MQAYYLPILVLGVPMVLCEPALAQGGPPYYTNDTATPGSHSWEINVGYMPFLYATQSTSHLPDLDINYGIGARIQLTYENAWLRVGEGARAAKYGLGQDQIGVKFRFVDNEKAGFAIATFPQVSVNNPNDSVVRGITPRGASLIVPFEFTKQLRSINVNWEVGYNLVHLGPQGWIAGIVAGHDVSKRFQVDAELYGLGTFNLSNNQQTLGVGSRYKLHPLCTLLLMAGRSVATAHNGQPFFVGYFGIQFQLPPKPF